MAIEYSYEVIVYNANLFQLLSVLVTSISTFKYFYQLFRNKYEVVAAYKIWGVGQQSKAQSAMPSCRSDLCLTQLKDWEKKLLMATVNKQVLADSHAVIKGVDKIS